MNRYFSLYGLFLLLFCGACSNSVVIKEAPALNKITKNSKFTVVLPEDHTTGYTWNLQNDLDSKKVEKFSSVWHGNQKGIYFNFKSLHEGDLTLRFVCRKFTDTVDVRTFLVKINAN